MNGANQTNFLSIPTISEGTPEKTKNSTKGTAENDWLDRHVRFIEDFTKEGRQIKDEITQKRNF